jgi:hypothetical protein
MPIALLKFQGKEHIDVDYTVGDIVRVVKPGSQYTNWVNLNRFVLGTAESYRIPYGYNDVGDIIALQNEALMKWKVIDVIFTVSSRYTYMEKKIIYLIRDKYGHNSFVDANALKLVRRPRPESIGIAEVKLYEY